MKKLEEICLEQQPIFSGKILNIHLDKVKLPNGVSAFREVVDHPGAVAVVPILNNGAIALVKQYRYPVKKVLFEIPAGKLEAGENPEVCASRELLEETGYSAKSIRKLTAIYTAPGFTNEVIHIYVAKDLEYIGQCPDEDEFIQIETIAPDEVKKMIETGEIQDAKTIAGLFLSGVIK